MIRSRFGFIFIVLERLVKVHDGLRQMVVLQPWRQWRHSREPKAQRFERIVLASPFWDDARAIIIALQPLYTVLRLTDREGCTLGLLYEFMDRLGEQIRTCTAFSAERFVLCIISYHD